jgi:hypothetical protein
MSVPVLSFVSILARCGAAEVFPRERRERIDMADSPTKGAKIYERPERKTLSPVMIVVLVLILATVGYLLYRALTPAARPNRATQTGQITRFLSLQEAPNSIVRLA